LPIIRNADVIGNAVKVMRIATGEDEEIEAIDDGKDKAAQSLGRRGGKARAASMTPERRAEIARKAAKKRWETSLARPQPLKIVARHSRLQRAYQRPKLQSGTDNQLRHSHLHYRRRAESAERRGRAIVQFQVC
jgi:hypothetical protein